jgi:microcystin-dependent protein
MAETSRFWDGLISEGAAGDAGTYSAANFADLIAALMSDRTGVLSGLAVVESSPAAKSVTVETGKALVYGRMYVNDAGKALTIADNASGNPRIDYIVLECDWTAQTIRLDVVQGTPAGSPSAPALTQTSGTLWQEPLAQVAVANGFTSITNTNITRERAWAIADYPGKVEPCALSSAPPGWLLCYGQAISRTTYRDLFDAIGTTYGVGDGSTTFNAPDLRGRVWAGKDNMGGSSANRVTDSQADSMGGVMGAETHTLTTAELASHSHGITAYMRGSGTAEAKLAAEDRDPDSVVGTATSNTAGSGTAHNNMQPTMFGNWIIKT